MEVDLEHVGEGRDAGRDAWRMLALLSVAELLGMSVWFAASAVAPHLRSTWGLSVAAAGWLTTAVQLGFVIWSTTASAMSAALLVAVAYRDGPHTFERRPFSWGLVGTVLRDREWRLATGGYLGHMWSCTRSGHGSWPSSRRAPQRGRASRGPGSTRRP